MRSLGGIRAVVVDDEELSRQYLCKMLSLANVEIVGQGETGKDALDLAERLHPDFLFMDIRMPDMSGWEAAAVIDQWDGGPKVVIVSADTACQMASTDVGSFDYLTKPVLPERLALMIERASLLPAIHH